jgi:hypothetical protein
MADFRQYTQCVDIADFNPANPWGQAALVGLYVTLPVGVVPFLIALAATGGLDVLCLLLVAEIFAIASVIGYCYWWLFRRLICIPDPPDHPAYSAGNHLVIGTLIDILLPASITQFPDIDNDYCMGILPACAPLGGDLDQVGNSKPYGYLVAAQPVTIDAGLLFTGNSAVDHEFKDHPELEIKSQTLHCEFEGRAVYDMFLAARFALFPVFAALWVCLFVPGIGWIIALILGLLGLAGLAIGLGIGWVDAGDPSDVNPNIGELHRNDEHHQGADTLVVAGHWVYDSGHRFDHHTGYNELHPITFCCKTSPVTNCDPDQVILLRNRWQDAIGDATSTTTLENQTLPQNLWQVHPVIDGCQPPWTPPGAMPGAHWSPVSPD